MSEYEAAKEKLDRFVNEVPLRLQIIDRETLERLAASTNKSQHPQTIEQQSVNYLRHCASSYDEIIRALNGSGEMFSTKMERHVLHVERRSCIARIKQRILDEIAKQYTSLQAECARQKQRDGIEDDPSEFVLPFGPFKGTSLRNVETDYLLRLLGQGFVRKAFRSRIERHLAQRSAAALPLPQ